MLCFQNMAHKSLRKNFWKSNGTEEPDPVLKGFAIGGAKPGVVVMAIFSAWIAGFEHADSVKDGHKKPDLFKAPICMGVATDLFAM